PDVRVVPGYRECGRTAADPRPKTPAPPAHRPVGGAQLLQSRGGPGVVRGGAGEPRGRHASGRQPGASLHGLAASGRPVELLLPPVVLVRLAGYAPDRTCCCP